MFWCCKTIDLAIVGRGLHPLLPTVLMMKIQIIAKLKTNNFEGSLFAMFNIISSYKQVNFDNILEIRAFTIFFTLLILFKFNITRSKKYSSVLNVPENLRSYIHTLLACNQSND